MKFDFVYLGQTVLKYQVPLEIFVGLNEIYERQKKQLPKANKQLVGKIRKENSLFYGGADNSKMHQHNLLPPYVLNWLESKFAYKVRMDIGVRLFSKYLNSPYTFHVEKKANKVQIKKAVESVYGVKVIKVRTINKEVPIT